MQDGTVYICLEQPQTFLCKVPKQGSLTRLEWRIDFDDSSSVEIVTREFTSADSEGHILRAYRPGVSFMFNLTSNSLESLISAMIITVGVNATALINNTTVNCGDEAYPKVVHVIEGDYYKTL